MSLRGKQEKKEAAPAEVLLKAFIHITCHTQLLSIH